MAKRTNYQWLYLVGYFVFFGLIWYSLRNNLVPTQPKQVPYSEFLSDVRAGQIADVRIDQTRLVATLKPEAVKKGESNQISAERLPSMDETSLLKELEDQHVTFSGHVD